MSLLLDRPVRCDLEHLALLQCKLEALIVSHVFGGEFLVAPNEGVCVKPQEDLHGLSMIVLCGQVDRSSATGVLGVEFSPVGMQELDELAVVSLG